MIDDLKKEYRLRRLRLGEEPKIVASTGAVKRYTSLGAAAPGTTGIRNPSHGLKVHHDNPQVQGAVTEPIVAFLAKIRRAGMDILFPKDTQDKVINCSQRLK